MTPVKIASSWLDDERHPGSVSALADEIAAYGEQCRRAGAEAMLEAIAKPFDDMGLFDIDGATLAESIRKTPPALVEKLRALDAEPPEASFTNLDEMMTYLNDTPAEAASPAAGWRSMDSAPMDGTWILLRGRNTVGQPIIPVVAAWSPIGSTNGRGWRDSGTFKPVDDLATYTAPTKDGAPDWMPLPPAPSEEARAG